MMDHAIAEHTWKLTHGGADSHIVSRHRFARRKANRAIHNHLPNKHLSGNGLRLVPETIPKPLSWGTSQRILLDADSDLFHPRIPLAYQSLVWETMALAQWHTFLVITRYPTVQRNTAELFNREPLPNVWLGVCVENRAQLQPRLEELRHTPAAVRFVSFDPLLERLGTLDLEGIDWVIVGGESSPRARPLHPEWVRSIRHQCLVSEVPFYFKNWGGYPAARVLDGRLWNERPTLMHGTPPPLHRRRALRWEIRRAVAYMFPREPHPHCPVCKCCPMVPADCAYCHGAGHIGGKGVPAEYQGPCLQCRGSGNAPECSGGCTPYERHGEMEQLELGITTEKPKGERYATAGF